MTDFPAVTANAQLLLGYIAGVLGMQREPLYVLTDALPSTGWLKLEHARTGNVFLVTVEQLAGTEWANETTAGGPDPAPAVQGAPPVADLSPGSGAGGAPDLGAG